MSNANMQGNGDIPAHHFQIGNAGTADHQNQSTIPIFPSSVSAGAIRNSEDMATMDDYQFSASLDALLDSDHLVGPNTGNDATTSATSTVNATNPGGVATAISAPGAALAAPPGAAISATGTGVVQGGTTAQHNTTTAATQYLVPATNVSTPAVATTAASVAAGPQGLAVAQPLQKSLASVSTAGHQPFVGPSMSSITARLGTFRAAVPNMNFGSSGVIPWAGQDAGTGQPTVVAGSVPTNATGGAAAANAARPIIPSFAASSNNDSNKGNSPAQTNVNQSSSTARTTLSSKRSRDVLAVSEDEGERERRRQDRNLREQQRSHRITEQISQLREVLSAANIQFKPDKYSTLTKVVEYMKELQNRSAMLDEEHQKLIDTIAQTNDIVNNQYVPAYTSGSDPPISSDALTDGSSSPSSEESLAFVRGIDYKSVFKNSGVALALTSIDGRFLDCNKEFETITGYARAELLPVEQLLQTQPRQAGILLTDGVGSGSMSVSFVINGKEIGSGRGNGSGGSGANVSGSGKGSVSSSGNGSASISASGSGSLSGSGSGNGSLSVVSGSASGSTSGSTSASASGNGSLSGSASGNGNGSVTDSVSGNGSVMGNNTTGTVRGTGVDSMNACGNINVAVNKIGDSLSSEASKGIPNPATGATTNVSTDADTAVNTKAVSSSNDTDSGSDRSKDNDGGKLNKNLSLFNILSRDDMQIVFVAMSNMLRHPGDVVARSERNSCGVKQVDYWSDKITLCRNVDESFQLNVTLVRNVMGRPKFFDCALSPVLKRESPPQALS